MLQSSRRVADNSHIHPRPTPNPIKMRILELQEYAKEKGFNSLKFKFTNLSGHVVEGKWLDAHYGFFRIDGMEDNQMVTVAQWRRLLGDSAIEFEPID